jgi:hypothetical protein
MSRVARDRTISQHNDRRLATDKKNNRHGGRDNVSRESIYCRSHSHSFMAIKRVREPTICLEITPALRKYGRIPTTCRSARRRNNLDDRIPRRKRVKHRDLPTEPAPATGAESEDVGDAEYDDNDNGGAFNPVTGVSMSRRDGTRTVRTSVQESSL